MTPTFYLETHCQDPAYNLAFEEYILTHFREGNLLILWQNAPSVIIGRNQNTAEEVNSAFVDAHRIRVVRRNTGGGAVYHDLGNLNYSFITDGNGLDKNTLQLFLVPVVQALQNLGLDAQCSGRNDILVSGKKVSGTAQQLLRGRILHHGTLLFDADMNMISGALNPDPTKFQSKSVKSVRSRVGNIRQALSQDMNMQDFWAYLKNYLTQNLATALSLSEKDLTAIEALKKEKYDTWEWNYGKSPKCQLRCKKRWDGGLLDLQISLSQGRISELHIFGDFLALRPVAELEEILIGCPYQSDALKKALSSVPLNPYLGTVTAQELIETILNTDCAHPCKPISNSEWRPVP